MMIEDLPEKYQDQARAKIGAPTVNNSKYHAVKTEVDGIRFSSQKEAKHYSELRLMERQGIISDLVLQPVFILQEPFICDGKKERAIKYIADFQYTDINGNTVVVDVKGKRTDVYKIKRKLFLYQYKDKVRFREV